MKLVNLRHQEDYVRFSKSLTIKVNDLITVEVDICGGVVNINSKLFGKVTVLEDPETDIIYYIGGKKTKYDGFKELYNQLFQDNYDDFSSSIDRFAENEVLNTFDNSINNLTKKQKIKLLKEQIDMMPTFESDYGEKIANRQWAVNEVLYTLNIPKPISKKYDRPFEDGSSYGVELSKYNKIYQQIKKENN